MAQISSFGALPDPNLYIPPAQSKTASTSDAQKDAASSTYASVTDEAQTSTLQPQLTRLSTVLSSFQLNANRIRTQYLEALNKVKSGSYVVNSLEVSRSIVSDLLPKQQLD